LAAQVLYRNLAIAASRMITAFEKHQNRQTQDLNALFRGLPAALGTYEAQ